MTLMGVNDSGTDIIYVYIIIYIYIYHHVKYVCIHIYIYTRLEPFHVPSFGSSLGLVLMGPRPSKIGRLKFGF